MKAARSRAKRGGAGDAAVGALCKVTAIVRVLALEAVERRLQQLGIPGISVTKVKGYGEYANFFRSDWTVEHARIEIYLHRARADEVARAIIEAARTGEPGDGVVVVLPVDAIYRIRSGEPATTDEIGGCQCDARSEEAPAHAREQDGDREGLR